VTRTALPVLLAEIDLADPQSAAERRADGLFGDRRLELFDGGHGLAVISQSGVVLGPGHGVLGHQGAGPVEVGPGQHRGRLGTGELRLLDGSVLAQQQFAGTDAAPRLEGDRHDLPRRLRGDGHPLDGGHRPHGRQLADPGLRLHGECRHGLRRRHEGFSLIDHFADLQGLDAGQDAGNEQNADDGENDAFFHKARQPVRE
jgi:hypothetical protein